MASEDTLTLCPPCEANHVGGETCFALRDSENGCECECDSSMGDIEGKTPREINQSQDAAQEGI